MFICCTGIGLLVQEQKMAETVLADLIFPETHWHWVVPVYLPLEVFVFGKGWQKQFELTVLSLKFIGTGFYLSTYPWRCLSLGMVLEWFPAWPNV